MQEMSFLEASRIGNYVSGRTYQKNQISFCLVCLMIVYLDMFPSPSGEKQKNK